MDIKNDVDTGKQQDEQREMTHAKANQYDDEQQYDEPWLKTILVRGESSDFVREALARYGDDSAIDPVREKKLRRRVDLIILPILSICYFFYYVDKTTLSYGAIFGLKEDLNLHGTQYSWLSSVFYFGWMAFAIPTNLLMQRCPPSTYLGFNIFMWGVLLMCQAAVKNFKELVVLRVLGGAAEAIADPAFMLVTAMWYTRAEQPSRISTWYAANGIGVAGGGLIGYGIGNIKSSLASWRYEFLIVGAFCSLWGLVIILFLPNSIPSARFFTRDERMFLIARLRKNQTGIDGGNKKIRWDQIREFATDPKSWMFLLLGLVANIPNGGISNFSTLIIKGLGFNTLETTLLGIPQGVLVIIWISAGAILNGRLPNNSRTLVCMLFMLPTIGGSLGFLLAPTHASAGRLVCYYLTGSYQASFVIALSLITSNVGGQTKKQLTSAFIFVGVCAGNIAGPFFFKSEQAPEYRLGIGAILVSNCLEFFIFIAFRYLFIWENKKKEVARAKLAGEGMSENQPELNDTAFADITDKQNVNFVYVY